MSPVHVHLALTHVPVLFIPLALFILLWGIKRQNPSIRKIAFSILVLASIISIPVFLTGEPAEETVENLPLVSNALIESHEEAAETAFIVTLITGAFSLLSLLLASRQKIEINLAKLIIVLAMVGSVSLLYTANLGGQIRHSEIRADGPPSTNNQKSIDKDHDDD